MNVVNVNGNTISIGASTTTTSSGYVGVTTTGNVNAGSYLTVNGSGQLLWSDQSKTEMEYMVEYIDAFSKVFGFPSFEKFKEMSDNGEVDAFIRVQKIKKAQE